MCIRDRCMYDEETDEEGVETEEKNIIINVKEKPQNNGDIIDF